MKYWKDEIVHMNHYLFREAVDRLFEIYYLYGHVIIFNKLYTTNTKKTQIIVYGLFYKVMLSAG